MAGSPVSVARYLRGRSALVLMAVLVISCASESDPAGVGDTDPPTVVSTAPAKDAEVSATTLVRVVFSEDMDAGSAADGVSVIGVAGSVTYDATTRTAEFSPDEPFVPGAYTLSIKRVQDIAGNLMVGAVTVSFVVR